MRKKSMALVVLLSAAMSLSIMIGSARAVKMTAIQTFDHNRNEDISIFTYDTLTDMATGYSAATNFIKSWDIWNANWTMSGLAYDGTQYIQAFEHNTNEDISFFTYDTLTDMATGYSAATNFIKSWGLWDPNWTMSGFAHDGTQYILAFDRDTNEDITFFTYDTLANVVTGPTGKTDFYLSWGLWNPNWTMSGLAYDGTQYIQAFDHNTNEDISFFTYDTLADVAAGWNANTGFIKSWDVWNPNWTMSGLAIGPIPEPSTILLLGTGLLGVVGIARRRKG